MSTPTGASLSSTSPKGFIDNPVGLLICRQPRKTHFSGPTSCLPGGPAPLSANIGSDPAYQLLDLRADGNDPATRGAKGAFLHTGSWKNELRGAKPAFLHTGRFTDSFSE